MACSIEQSKGIPNPLAASHKRPRPKSRGLMRAKKRPGRGESWTLSQGVFHAWGQWSAVGLIRNAPGARGYAADTVNNPWMRDTADQSPKGHRTNGRSILFAWSYGEDDHGIKGLVCIGQTTRDIPLRLWRSSRFRHRSLYPRRRLSCVKASSACPAANSSSWISTSSCPWPRLSPVQAHGPEEILLYHQAVEAPDALLRADPVQHEMVLDG
jgi:hypothetical protein